MNLSLISRLRLSLCKIFKTLNILIMLSFSNSASAGIISTIGDGWDGPGQGAFNVKYYFGTLTTDNGLVASEIYTAFLIGFNAWSDATNNNLTFTEIFDAGQTDSIDISFENSAHGDGFDFNSNILAHAFYPDDSNPDIIAGDLHMNDEGFSWEIGNGLGSSAYDITRVAVHEIGHSIGLGHTTTGSGNIMDPTISSSATFTQLSTEDVNAVCSLYLCTSIQVPEPSTLGLILFGLFGAAVAGRRKNIPLKH